MGSDRTSGNQASRPNASRHQVWIGPATPNVELTTKPKMYAGRASGSTSAHVKKPRPGKS